MDTKTHVACVTGGAKRIGREIALELAALGCDVALHYHRSQGEAASTVAELRRLGVRAKAFRADISDTRQVARMARNIERGLGPVDILINNAAVFERTPWPDVSDTAWSRHIDTNLKGPFLCARAFSPSMVSRGWGKIIMLTDAMSQRPRKDYVPYSASKAGLTGLMLALAKALAPRVQVNAVAVGPILPPPQGIAGAEKRAIERGTLLLRYGTPRDIAMAVSYLVFKAPFVTGSVLTVDGGRAIA